MTAELTGLETVMRNLNAEINRMEGATLAGLLAGGLVVQRAAQKNVPVEYGDTRASAYTRKAMDEPGAVDVGFGAAHAVYLHENMEQKLKGQPRPSGLGVYWGPSGGPKFLERALTETSHAVLNMVAAYAKVR